MPEAGNSVARIEGPLCHHGSLQQAIHLSFPCLVPLWYCLRSICSGLPFIFSISHFILYIYRQFCNCRLVLHQHLSPTSTARTYTMQYRLLLPALAASAYAYPNELHIRQGVTAVISKTGTAAGCSPTYAGTFGIAVMNVTSASGTAAVTSLPDGQPGAGTAVMPISVVRCI